MISISFDEVTIKGNRVDIMTELTSLIKSLLQEDILTIDQIKYCLELAQKDNETLTFEANAAIRKFIEKIPSFIRPMVEDDLNLRLKKFAKENDCLQCDHSNNCLGYSIAQEVEKDNFSSLDFLMNHLNYNNNCSDKSSSNKDSDTDIFKNIFKDLL